MTSFIIVNLLLRRELTVMKEIKENSDASRK